MDEHGFLGERRLNLKGLDSQVRRIVLTTYAVLLALAACVVVGKRLPGHDIVTFVGVNLRSSNVAIAATPLCIAVAMLLAGAAHAKTRWRYLLLVPIAFALVMTIATGPAAFPDNPAARAILAVIALPLPFAAAYFVIARAGPGLRTATTFALSLALCVSFAASVLVVTFLTGSPYGPTVVFMIAGIAAVALQPAFLVVGFDLAEVGAKVARLVVPGRDAAHLRARVLSYGLIAAGFVAALGLQLGMGYSGSSGWSVLAIWTALFVLAALAARWMMVRRPYFATSEHSEIGYLQVLLIAVVVIFSDLVPLRDFNEPKPGYTNYAAARPFSLRVPTGMTESSSSLPDSLKASTPTHVGFLTDGKPPTLSVTGWPHAFPGYTAEPPSEVADLNFARNLPRMPLELAPPDKDGWARGVATARSGKGESYRFVILRWDFISPDVTHNTSWYIVCGGRANEAERVEDMCEDVRKSFAPRPATESSRPAAVGFSLLYAAGAAGAMALGLRQSRRSDAPLLNFAAWALFLTCLRWMGGYLFGGVDDPVADLHFAAQLLAALVFVAAGAAGFAAAWPVDRALGFDLLEVRRIASQALAHLLIIAGLFFLYVFAIGRGEDSQAIRGVIIVLALTWELATAGQSLNSANEHSVFPHGSRVLIFSGYLILIATCVFLFGPSHTIDGQRIVAYDTESIVANGLVILGGALAVSRALRGLPTLRRPPEPKTSDAENLFGRMPFEPIYGAAAVTSQKTPD